MADAFSMEFQHRNRRFKEARTGLDFFAKELERSMDGAHKVVSKGMRKYLEGVSRSLTRRHGTPWPGGTTSRSLSKRSGRAVRSIQSSVRVKGKTLNTVEGRIGGVFYLATHETGARITARKSKFLTIPLRAALNSDGTPKKKRARAWRNTFVAKSKKGNLIIFQKRGGRIVPLYVLKRSVKIPPRLNMRSTLEAGIPFFVDQTLDALVKHIRDKV